MKTYPFKLLAIVLLLLARPVMADQIRLSLPPDPNALPVFVLMEKQAEFLPEDELKLVANPAGDPSAMRAMIQAKHMDFALFNLIGGTRFIQGGLQGVHLVSPWVWRGIYLMTPVEQKDLSALNGATVLVAPGISTPPHIITAKALEQKGIKPQFVTGGAGAVLMSQMRNPKKSPAGVAAPEPLVSLIQSRQEKENWAQRWEIRFDPTQALQGDVPLGAVWQVHDGVDPEVRQRFLEAMNRAAQWAQKPENHLEAARIAAKGYKRTFRMPIPAETLQHMLEAQRVVWKAGDNAQTRATVQNYLNDVFGIQQPEGLYLP